MYVFTKPASGWADETQAAKLTGPARRNRDDAVGSSVAVSGTTIAAGAPGATVNGNLDQGAVYVFTRAASGGPWTQTAKLTATDGAADDYLGSSVAVSGTTIAAGAPDATVNENLRSGRGVCVHQARPRVGG